MPARSRGKSERRKKFREKKAQTKRASLLSRKVFIYAIIFVVFAVVAYLINTHSSLWDKQNKLSVVTSTDEGEVSVIVFDPRLDEITTISIPQETQVTTARQLGSWRTKSLWKLGKDEELDGALLAETLTYHMRFPTRAWASDQILALNENNLSGVLKFIFLEHDTNLTISDRIQLGVFSLGVTNTSHKSVDLSRSTYLRRETLSDGEEGYVVSRSMPQNLVVIFTNENVSKERVTVVITDHTGEPGLAENLGKSIEVTGVSVGSISRKESLDMDCVAKSQNIEYARYLAGFYGCVATNEAPAGNFDIEIAVGEEFAERF